MALGENSVFLPLTTICFLFLLFFFLYPRLLKVMRSCQKARHEERLPSVPWSVTTARETCMA